MASISRADALALLARQDVNEIIKPATEKSAALSAFRKITMTAGTARMPVLSAIPTAGWVKDSATDPDGAKPTTGLRWEDKELVAEEVACIVPIPENVLDDSRFDIWAEVRPLVATEFARVLDAAVLFGTNKPATWTSPALVPGAAAAGNVVTESDDGDLADDFNSAFAYVENDDFDVNAAFTGRFLRAELRGLRDKNGQPIYLDSLRSDGVTSMVYGQDLYYVGNRVWDKAAATALVGDANAAVLGIRQDMQVKLLDQATVGGINLAERDMVALRFKFRVGFAVAFSAPGAKNPTKTFPFAIIKPGADGIPGKGIGKDN